MKWFGKSTVAAGLILATAIGMAAAPASSGTNAANAEADLAWFMAGLRDLCKSKDSRLKLQPAQAKKILPELEALVNEKILIVEMPARQNGASGQTGQGGFAYRSGAGQTGGGSDAQRQKMLEQRQKRTERIENALDKMQGFLRQPQSDYILNLNFDPDYYGLGSFQMQRNSQGMPSNADLQKMMQARRQGMQRLVQLNKEVLDLVKKLAK